MTNFQTIQKRINRLIMTHEGTVETSNRWIELLRNVLDGQSLEVLRLKYDGTDDSWDKLNPNVANFNTNIHRYRTVPVKLFDLASFPMFAHFRPKPGSPHAAGLKPGEVFFVTDLHVMPGTAAPQLSVELDMITNSGNGIKIFGFAHLREHFEYSVDGNKTWHPCHIQE